MVQFGVSTHLYQGGRLECGHLDEIASHGFESIELFATRPHFDYRSAGAVEDLAGWLLASKLDMPSVHAPVAEAIEVLDVARRIPFQFLVVHAPLATNHAAAVRSIEDIHNAAEPLGVKLALEVMADSASTVDALVGLIEGELDGLNLGICMDVGHAFMTGDTADAIESASGYLLTAHIHDNRRQRDDHLLPFEGGIDWAATMMAFEKIGYDGVLTFEARNEGVAGAVLERAERAREKLTALRGIQWPFL